MIYHIYANQSNIGDWLSAKGIQKLLNPLPITDCFCDLPFLEKTFAQLSNATAEDMIVIGGGGLFMDYFNPFWESFERYADTIPFCIWGVGYCDLKNEDSIPHNNLIENIVSKTKVCIVRDELSRKHLKSLNLPSPVPCPSINVIAPVAEQHAELLHVDNYTTAGAETYDKMCLAAEAFAREKNIKSRQTNNRINNNSEKELAAILSLYEQSGYVLSSALHGCIIAVAMGKKVLAVSGDWKIEGFMEAVGLSDWVLDVNQVNILPDKLKELDSQVLNPGILNNIIEKNRMVGEQIKLLASGET